MMAVGVPMPTMHEYLAESKKLQQKGFLNHLVDDVRKDQTTHEHSDVLTTVFSECCGQRGCARRLIALLSVRVQGCSPAAVRRAAKLAFSN